MKKTGVYILKCGNLRYYVGSADNFERRLKEHQQGWVKSTMYVLPVATVFFQSCDSLTTARKLEYRIKTKKSREIIEKIIKDGYIKFKH